ncbi:unnamed protein product [Musa textilis]
MKSNAYTVPAQCYWRLRWPRKVPASEQVRQLEEPVHDDPTPLEGATEEPVHGPRWPGTGPLLPVPFSLDASRCRPRFSALISSTTRAHDPCHAEVPPPPPIPKESLALSFTLLARSSFSSTQGLRPKILLYRNKVTNEPKGYPTITYEDPHAALAAVEWFHNKDFHGAPIEVHIVESKAKDLNDHSYAQQNGFEANSSMVSGVHDDVDGGGGRGRGCDDASGQAWQKDGD